MSDGGRGILYVVWGSAADAALNRSIASVKRHHPELPIHVERLTPEDPSRALLQKSKMGGLTPFETTLYLDADTVVMGKLDFAFEQAERFGMTVSICECPWTRRYGADCGDRIEYNTGVICFTPRAKAVLDKWRELAPIIPSVSRWTTLDNVLRGMKYDDQASFSQAVWECGFNPFVLPINYNLRPEYHQCAFLPVKVWHDYRDPPDGLEAASLACEQGQRLVTWITWREKKTEKI